MKETNSVLSAHVAEQLHRRLAETASIYVTVFLTGAAVLILEILGTKLLSPHFGNNLYVWSALISVTMVALAAGYWIGGVLADRIGRQSLLDQVIAVAAVWVAIIPALVSTVADPLLELDYRAGILLTALVSFGPALLLLGMVTPVAVKLAVRDLGKVGRTAGAVYSCSTAGGIVGALAAGFLLFPVVAVSRICLITALALMTLAASRWLARSRWSVLAVVPGLLLVGTGVVAPGSFLPPDHWVDGDFRVVSNQPSFYGTVRVVEYRGHRMLTIDGLCHNAQRLSDRRSAMPHVWMFGALPYLRPGGEQALLIGLGGGDMVRLLRDFGIRSTAIEIDPVVIDVAFKQFGLRRRDVTVIEGDGRYLLRTLDQKYDYVIVDAFMGGTVPAHLFTREAFEEMRRRLRPGGVVAFNVAIKGRNSRLVRDLITTIRSVFPQLLLFATATTHDDLGNLVVFASNQPLALPDQWFPPPKDPMIADVLKRLPAQAVDPNQYHGVVLTDELNRVEADSIETEIALRMDTRALLPPSLLEP